MDVLVDDELPQEIINLFNLHDDAATRSERLLLNRDLYSAGLVEDEEPC